MNIVGVNDAIAVIGKIITDTFARLQPVAVSGTIDQSVEIIDEQITRLRAELAALADKDLPVSEYTSEAKKLQGMIFELSGRKADYLKQPESSSSDTVPPNFIEDAEQFLALITLLKRYRDQSDGHSRGNWYGVKENFRIVDRIICAAVHLGTTTFSSRDIAELLNIWDPENILDSSKIARALSGEYRRYSNAYWRKATKSHHLVHWQLTKEGQDHFNSVLLPQLFS